MMELSIVQHDAPRIPNEVRPHVIVARRVAELIDHQVIGMLEVSPDEIVGTQNRSIETRHLRRARPSLDEYIDRIIGNEAREQIGVVPRHPRSQGRKGCKPRDPGRQAHRTAGGPGTISPTRRARARPPRAGAGGVASRGLDAAAGFAMRGANCIASRRKTCDFVEQDMGVRVP